MDLIDQTRVGAVLLRAAVDDDHLMASVVLRERFAWVDGALVSADTQDLTPSDRPVESVWGSLEPEVPYRRDGVDVFLFGSARAPREEPVETMAVELRVGPHQRRFAVTGDRVWRKQLGGFEPTRPLPFVRMPLSVDRAYGGSKTWDGLPVKSPDNPLGRGFCVGPDDVDGTPLPNLEWFDDRVRRWDTPVRTVGLGLCRMANAGRLMRAIVRDADDEILDVTPALFNCAWPEMVLPEVPHGTVVTVSGVDPQGPVSFALPPDRYGVELAFDDDRYERSLVVDQVYIDTDRREVAVTYRFPFRYRVIPHQIRTARVWPRFV